jgi:type VI protein secretion system component VasF
MQNRTRQHGAGKVNSEINKHRNTMAREENKAKNKINVLQTKENIVNVLLAIVTQLLIVVFQKNVSLTNITGDCL